MSTTTTTTTTPSTPPRTEISTEAEKHLLSPTTTTVSSKKQKTMTSPPPAAAAPTTAAAAATATIPLTTTTNQLQILHLTPAAHTPTRGSAFAAGYDMYAARAMTVPARGKALVDTDIAIAVPAGTYGRIAPRSGLAVKFGIDVGAGVVDEDYRGQVRILLFNHSDNPFDVAPGDRIAQLVLERIVTPDVVVVQELAESVRGAGGFGSTGVGAN